MSNWYYYDASGNKNGPVRASALKALAQQGIVTPETIIENEQGRAVKASDVRGIAFPENRPIPASVPVPLSIPRPPTIATSSIPTQAFLISIPNTVRDFLLRLHPGIIVAIILFCAVLIVILGLGISSAYKMAVSIPKKADMPLAAKPPQMNPQEPSKRRMVVVSIDTYSLDCRPAHAAIYEIWVNDEKIDSKTSTESFAIFIVEVPCDSVKLQARVHYKNGYGAVMNERRATIYRNIPSDGEIDTHKIKVGEYTR